MKNLPRRRVIMINDVKFQTKMSWRPTMYRFAFHILVVTKKRDIIPSSLLTMRTYDYGDKTTSDYVSNDHISTVQSPCVWPQRTLDCDNNLRVSIPELQPPSPLLLLLLAGRFIFRIFQCQKRYISSRISPKQDQRGSRCYGLM